MIEWFFRSIIPHVAILNHRSDAGTSTPERPTRDGGTCTRLRRFSLLSGNCIKSTGSRLYRFTFYPAILGNRYKTGL